MEHINYRKTNSIKKILKLLTCCADRIQNSKKNPSMLGFQLSSGLIAFEQFSGMSEDCYFDQSHIHVFTSPWLYLKGLKNYRQGSGS